MFDNNSNQCTLNLKETYRRLPKMICRRNIMWTFSFIEKCFEPIPIAL
jgi:hypothetical protein